jgi:hypothetical protein
MAKVMTTPIMTFLQFSFYNKKFSRGILFALTVTCVGVVLATAAEVKLTLLGLSIALAGCFATAIYSIVTCGGNWWFFDINVLFFVCLFVCCSGLRLNNSDWV